ncbi:Transcriptional regulator MNL1 [Grifola frondosa]|uniref:Transcriptional regulator MNL1 n=1 Tax=Grifola frondosa TaxID=5627 RepID=A0A1C7LVL2_GRIFR|nr:Transcriptional regulator MNL1 [Grifola frondosa]
MFYPNLSQMDASVLFQLPSHQPHHQPLNYNYFDSSNDVYQPLMSPQSSFSPASSSSASGSNPTDSSPTDSPLDYVTESADYDAATVAGSNVYPADDYGDSRHTPWAAAEKQGQFQEFYSNSSFDMSASFVGSAVGDANNLLQQCLKQDESAYPDSDDYALSPYYDVGADPSLASYAALSGYHNALHHASLSPNPLPAGPPPSLAFGFSPQTHVQPSIQEPTDVPQYMLSSTSNLQYPPTSEETPCFVHPAQISPAISPAAAYAQLQEAAQSQGCDPRFTVNNAALLSGGVSPTGHTDFDVDSASGSTSDSPALERATLQGETRPRKRQRHPSFTSSEDEYKMSDSGESEKEDDMDDEFVLRSARQRTRRRHTVSSSSPAPSNGSSSLTSGRRLAPPVPVPNLTKKSRGRRVPTHPVIVSQGGVEKNARMYMCKVPGCGKCFARGEHLKRHVRSIHTNEKPHKCPVPGCGKDFSRHDNLGQHMRVHKNWSAPKSRV